jgi:hypothetical protein
MIHRTQSCTLGAILFLVAAFLPGCGEDNQKSARTGESNANPNAKDKRTEEERKAAGIGTRSGSPSSKPANYPKSRS